MFSPIPDSGNHEVQESCFQALLDSHLGKRVTKPLPIHQPILCGKKKRRIPEPSASYQHVTVKRAKLDEGSEGTPSTLASDSVFRPLEDSPQLGSMKSPTNSNESPASLNIGPSLLSQKRDLKRRAYSHDEPDVGALVCRCCRKERRGLQAGLCTRCSKGLAKAAGFAGSYGGSAIIGDAARSVKLTCAQGHAWTVPLAKACRAWCGQCRSERQARKSKELEDLRARIESKNIKLQQELFQEAQESACPEALSIDQLLEPVAAEAQSQAELDAS